MNQIIQQFTEGENSFPIIGYITWWNVHNVDILRDKLIQVLQTCGIDEKFARTHNFRCAFIRSLRELEENRIIRLVKETKEMMLYQFTAETFVDEEEVKLEYNPESLVAINKEVYRKTKNVEESISGREDIVEKLIEHFLVKKDKYHSSDITRLIQRVFSEKADIVCLREQGGVYFVPSQYQNIIQAVSTFVNNIGNSNFQYFPLPNVEACRNAVANAVENEMKIDLNKLEEEMEAVASNEKEVTEKWYEHRLTQITNLNNRVQKYIKILNKNSVENLENNFNNLRNSIIGSRNLDI